MPRVHVVKQGECLSEIARRYGFGDPLAVYQASENEALRKKRPDPNVLHPGDEVVIPDPKKKDVTLATSQVHKIVVKLPRRRLRIKLQDSAGEPLANMPYKLVVGAFTVEARTDGDGLLDQEIPSGEAEGRLLYGRSEHRLQIGALNPLADTDDDGVTGVQARLSNLGYDPGAVDGVLGPRTAEAIEAFQRAHQLEATGKIDDQLLSALKDEHGC